MSQSTVELRPALLRHWPLALHWYSRTISGLCAHLMAVAIGWQRYTLTGNPFDLGLVGLAQFLPLLGLTLTAGQVADRYDRRTIFPELGRIRARDG